MEINNILITGNLANDIKKVIDPEQYPQTFRFIEEKSVTSKDLQWADGYVAFKPTTNFEFFDIKWVHSLGAGVDGFLFGNKWKEDVLLTRTICSFGQRISQYCLSYYLKDLQEHDSFREKESHKQWQPVTPKLIKNQKALVYGTGEIGQEIAKLFSSLGIEVYGVSLSGSQKPHFSKVYSISTETEILSEVDVVINTLPLTKETDKLFGKDLFNYMNHAIFINVGRGSSVVESDLIDALQNNTIRLAVLDVFKEEPLPVDHRFWELENVRITPHISAVTTVEEAVDCFLETLNKLKDKSVLKNKVDTSLGY
ncbi:D-2-hydroxyacid dehydrogenase [Aquibacillus saliphilus]|uniref:D-2-hydroxyacid dehydrogenase n=1 Tax=Aquibacillus saliphilus TaxID=1909422 RepID=UPI001CF05CE1|nr:D-2-hydroxyacid dehydrogenase [Aquibacillus saliphilus]